MPRIIAGNLKGRKISLAPGVDSRPTTDRVREALFSALSSMISFEGRTCVDLYCGSGALGIEAMSRGAKDCLFVDVNRKQTKHLRVGLEELGLSGSTEVVEADVFSFLRATRHGQKAGLIFADPPYALLSEAETSSEALLHALLQSGLADSDALLVLEGSAEYIDLFPEVVESPNLSFKCVKQKRYGQSVITIYGAVAPNSIQH